jgi:hypothetical protein
VAFSRRKTIRGLEFVLLALASTSVMAYLVYTTMSPFVLPYHRLFSSIGVGLFFGIPAGFSLLEAIHGNGPSGHDADP